MDANGNTVALYKYDPFGNPIHASGSLATINPLRYRGYYYDTETGLYYLQSRYYDPVVGRFLNADEYTSTGQGIIGNNMFAYCGNNPTIREDSDGKAFETAFDVVSLGASIADVVLTPADPWAWAGLAGDLLDVAIPFVGGIGETVKCFGAVNKANDIVDAANKIKKSVSKSVGTYEIIYKSGKNYVGKGSFNRAIQSAKRYANPHKLNGGMGDEILSITWKKTADDKSAYITEYLWQHRKSGVLKNNPTAKTYNIIWSPGRKHCRWTK